MSTTATATIPTASGSRYLQQLCKHWSHKFETQFDEQAGEIALPLGKLSMTAEADTLTVRLESASEDPMPRMKEVVAEHLDRFAFREAPLPFDWQ